MDALVRASVEAFATFPLSDTTERGAARCTHVKIGTNNGYPVPVQCGSVAAKDGGGRCTRHKGLTDARTNAIHKIASLDADI